MCFGTPSLCWWATTSPSTISLRRFDVSVFATLAWPLADRNVLTPSVRGFPVIDGRPVVPCDRWPTARQDAVFHRDPAQPPPAWRAESPASGFPADPAFLRPRGRRLFAGTVGRGNLRLAADLSRKTQVGEQPHGALRRRQHKGSWGGMHIPTPRDSRVRRPHQVESYDNQQRQYHSHAEIA
jgi:hypothetical protein